jgi:lysozyme
MAPANARYVALLLAGLLGTAECRAQPEPAQDAAPWSGICPNGAPAKGPEFCRFFVHFDADAATKPLDVRIRDALGISSAADTRSIGLVISVDSYPHLPGGSVSAAGVDGKRLVNFLVDQQKFDEVIHLSNADATTANIEYFLEEYLASRSDDFKKPRLLIAFSGHGRYGTPDGSTDRRAAFLLSDISDINGSSNIYKMDALANDVEALAGRYFHVLTLINACYGAAFFNRGGAGNADVFNERGAYAITAGARNDIVPALDPTRGSLFFDLIIEGVTNGKADPLYWEIYGPDGEPLRQVGLTRTMALSTYLTSSYERIIRQRARSNTPVQLSTPWIGATQRTDAPGGFFFLSDRSDSAPLSAADAYIHGEEVRKEAATQILGADNALARSIPSGALTAFRSRAGELVVVRQVQAPHLGVTIPAGPASSVPGRPELKVFKAPDIYPVKGYDLSEADGKIDWERVRRARPPRFIYARAVGWGGPDPTFTKRWRAARSLGIDVGAYVKYDFCRTPAAQFGRLARIVPRDPDVLPPAIEIVHPQGEDRGRLRCLEANGMDNARQGILDLAALVQAHYGKIPLLYGNRSNLSQFLDERADAYMLWLGNFGKSAKNLPGRNPWTLWQYSGSLDVKGIGKATTGEVFFGTEAQYQEFKKGLVNVALQAVSGPAP